MSTQSTLRLQKASDHLWKAHAELLLWSQEGARQVSRTWAKEQLRVINKVRNEVISQLSKTARGEE